MKRRTFQPTSGGSAPPRTTSRGQHVALRLVLIVFVVLFLVVFVPAPWSFHIGGQFTPFGQWDGYGPLRASNGGRYLLFTHIQGGVARLRRPPQLHHPWHLRHPAGQRAAVHRERADVLLQPGRQDARLADHR